MLWESLLQPAVLPVTAEFFFYHRRRTSRPLTNWKVTGTPELFEAFQRREVRRKSALLRQSCPSVNSFRLPNCLSGYVFFHEVSDLRSGGISCDHPVFFCMIWWESD